MSTPAASASGLAQRRRTGGAGLLPPLSPSADVVKAMVVRPGRPRLGDGSRPIDWPPPLVIVGVLAYTVSELGNDRPVRKLVIGLPVITVLMIVAHRRTRPADRRNVVVPPGLILYLVWVVASLTWTVDQHDSRNQITEYLIYGAVGVLLAGTLDLRQLQRVFAIATKIFVAATAVMLVVAYHAATRPAVDDAPGWHGPFGHKNTLGFLMATGLISLVLQRPWPRRQRIWIALDVVLLLGSESGAALAVALSVGSIGLWAVALGEVDSVGRRVLIKMLSTAVAAIGAVFLITDFPAATHLFGKNPTLTGRTKIWVAVLHAIAAKPVRGYGLGGVWLNTSGETARLWTAIGFKAFEAHDAYLDLLLQVGAVGAVLLLATILNALIREARAFRTAPAAGKWVLLVLAAFLVEGVAESDLTGEGLFVIGALVTASAMGARARRIATAP